MSEEEKLGLLPLGIREKVERVWRNCLSKRKKAIAVVRCVPIGFKLKTYIFQNGKVIEQEISLRKGEIALLREPLSDGWELNHIYVAVPNAVLRKVKALLERKTEIWKLEDAYPPELRPQLENLWRVSKDLSLFYPVKGEIPKRLKKCIPRRKLKAIIDFVNHWRKIGEVWIFPLSVGCKIKCHFVNTKEMNWTLQSDWVVVVGRSTIAPHTSCWITLHEVGNCVAELSKHEWSGFEEHKVMLYVAAFKPKPPP